MTPLDISLHFTTFGCLHVEWDDHCRPQKCKVNLRQTPICPISLYIFQRKLNEFGCIFVRLCDNYIQFVPYLQLFMFLRDHHASQDRMLYESTLCLVYIINYDCGR